MPASWSSLRGGQQPAGNFAAHHLDAGLALAINAVLQAEGTEFVLGDGAASPGPRWP